LQFLSTTRTPSRGMSTADERQSALHRRRW
jgi:hypothetical protein